MADEKQTREEPGRLQRVQLRYCPRCGALGVRPAGTAAGACGSCLHALRWVHAAARKPTEGGTQ